MRSIALAVCTFGLFATHTALAGSCPPGYRGTPPKCVPAPVPPHRVYTMTPDKSWAPGSTTMHAKPHSVAPTMLDHGENGPPIGPGPIEHRPGTANEHGIIFVGGKNTSGAQTIAHSRD